MWDPKTHGHVDVAPELLRMRGFEGFRPMVKAQVRLALLNPLWSPVMRVNKKRGD